MPASTETAISRAPMHPAYFSGARPPSRSEMRSTTSAGHGGRILVGVLVGLAFVEKMAAVAVVLPLLAWLVVAHLPQTFNRRTGHAEWADGVTTTVALLSPMVLVLVELVRLARLLPPPGKTDLFLHRPEAYWPGAILACPLAIWIVRRALFRLWRGHPVWARNGRPWRPGPP